LYAIVVFGYDVVVGVNVGVGSIVVGDALLYIGVLVGHRVVVVVVTVVIVLYPLAAVSLGVWYAFFVCGSAFAEDVVVTTLPYAFPPELALGDPKAPLYIFWDVTGGSKLGGKRFLCPGLHSASVPLHIPLQ
jgi:hypothetical protein